MDAALQALRRQSGSGDQDDIKQSAQVLLEQYDLEVQQRVEAIKTEIEAQKRSFSSRINPLALKITKRIKGMTVGEYREAILAIDNDPMAPLPMTESKTRADLMAPIAEPPSTRTRNARRKRVLQDNTNSMPPPTTQPRGKKAKAPASSSSSNAFITPAANSASARITQATPAMDPRLPTTPFLRSARKGECLVSENGSPVMLDSDGVHVRASSSRGTRDTIITVPLDNGKAIELSADALQNADGPSKMLSKKQKAAAKSYLTSLQEQVGALLQQLM